MLSPLSLTAGIHSDIWVISSVGIVPIFCNQDQDIFLHTFGMRGISQIQTAWIFSSFFMSNEMVIIFSECPLTAINSWSSFKVTTGL